MPNFLGGIQLPPVSEEFINQLSTAFRPYEVKPAFCRDALMQSVGEQKVLDFIRAKALQGRTVTGDPTAVRTAIPTGAVVKLGK